MGWSESTLGCKKHPTINQSPGVCSSCLRERLSQLSASCNYKARSKMPGSYSFNSSPSSPVYINSSDSSSTYVSAANRRRRHRRNGSEAKGSLAFLFSSGGDGLKKSRSMAFVPRNIIGEVRNEKRSGFWSKLLGSSTAKKINKQSLSLSKAFSQSLRV